MIGFNVRPDNTAVESAKRAGVDIRLYRIIYEAIEEVQSAMKGLLAPKYKKERLEAQVRQVFPHQILARLPEATSNGQNRPWIKRSCRTRRHSNIRGRNILTQEV